TTMPTSANTDAMFAGAPVDDDDLVAIPDARRRTARGGSSTAGGAGGDIVALARPHKPVSLRDVAKMAKVSVATVSMVLNDNPRISRATHMRVQRLMDRMGYQPNRLAQSLSGRYTQVLAVLLPALRHAFADAYFGELISGICDRA